VLAVFAAGVVGAVGGYVIRGHGGNTSHRLAVPARHNGRVYTLREGDSVRVPVTATRCVVSGEAGIPNLFCDRIGSGGRFEVVFWSDSVDLYDLARHGEPMVPTYSVPAELRRKK